MESIERAIRNAFTKADATNSEIRQRIYTSAWQAHERALAQNTQLDEAQRNQRREQLTKAIHQIEQEFFTPAPELKPDLAASPVAPNQPSNISGDLDSVAPSRQARSGQAHQNDDIAVPNAPRRTKNKDTKPKKRSLFSRLIIPLVLLLGFVIIGFSIYNSLVEMSGSSFNGNGRSALNTGPFKEGEDPDNARWITVFTPQDATRISLTDTATAQITNVNGTDYLRVKSPTPKSTINFDIGEGILNQFVNKTATFDIIARSSDGQPVQISVTCNFGDMGNCQRRRYDVTGSQSDFLFEVPFTANQRTQKNGTISIHSDLDGSGRAVDILAIRVAAN